MKEGMIEFSGMVVGSEGLASSSCRGLVALVLLCCGRLRHSDSDFDHDYLDYGYKLQSVASV